MPQAAMTVNHTIMTGPKRRPTRAVPNRWAANSATMITAVMGMTSGSSSGSDHLEPLHRRQDRDRRGDHAVAEEQGGAEDAQSRQQQLGLRSSPASAGA